MKKMLPIRIKKFPEKNYKNKVCLIPFNTISIDSIGNVRTCGCSGWLPTVVGNIFNNTIDEILNTDLSKNIRQSIRDGSYIYCNENTCGVIANNQLVDLASDIEIKEYPGGELYNNESATKSPTMYFIAGDNTCNLSCPSCRTKIIKNSEFDMDTYQQTLDILNQQLFNGSNKNPINITLSTSGEVFASSMLMNFLINFPLDRYPKTQFRLQTNGLLLKSRWSRISNIIDHITEITVTADSCVSDVYKKLRRGGEFVDLIENLNFISELKQNLNFKFNIRMVIQKDNCQEIEQFYAWGKKLGADRIEYTRLADWGTYTSDEFYNLDTLNDKHELYNNTIKQIQNLRSQYNDISLYGFNC